MSNYGISEPAYSALKGAADESLLEAGEKIQWALMEAPPVEAEFYEFREKCATAIMMGILDMFSEYLSSIEDVPKEELRDVPSGFPVDKAPDLAVMVLNSAIEKIIAFKKE